MTRSFVFVDQTFSSLTVHDRLHFVKCFLCSSFVASFDSCVYFLDESTHHRATACVVLASLFRLNARFLADLILAKVQLPNVFYMDNSKAEEYARLAFFVNGFVQISAV